MYQVNFQAMLCLESLSIWDFGTTSYSPDVVDTGNMVGRDALQQMVNLSSLRVLQLRQLCLSVAALPAGDYLSKLNFLDISKNRLDGIPAVLSGCRNLQVLLMERYAGPNSFPRSLARPILQKLWRPGPSNWSYGEVRLLLDLPSLRELDIASEDSQSGLIDL